MTRLFFLTILLVLVGGGCKSTTDPEIAVAGGPLSIRASGDALELRNTSSMRVHYVAVEATTAARLDLYFNPEQWAALDPGADIRIQYDQLVGFTPIATDAIVYWWTALGFGNATIRLK